MSLFWYPEINEKFDFEGKIKSMCWLDNGEEVEFNQEDIKVTIRPVAKKIKFQLKSIASEKFADIPAANDIPFFEISAKDLKEMIQQTIFSVSNDSNRYFMTGVYFTKKEDKEKKGEIKLCLIMRTQTLVAIFGWSE